MKNTIFVFILINIRFLQTSQAQFESLKKKTEDTIKKEIEKQPEAKDEQQKDNNEAQTNNEKTGLPKADWQ